MFSLYSEQQSGTALWTELQNVTLEANGQYTVLLGSQHSDGVPAELFTTNEARWLGIQVEAEPEQPRVLLVSVPYALKAGDAETLGGKPVSAFLLNPAAVDGSTTDTAATITSSKSSINTAGVLPSSVNTGASGGTSNFVAKWIDAATLGNSSIVDNGNIGIGTTTPLNPLHVNGVIRIGDNTSTSLPSAPLEVGVRIGPSNGSENAGIDLFNSSFASGYGWLINSPDRLGGNTPLAFKFRQNSGTWSELVTFRADTQRVGIATVNPQSNLHVNGAIRVGDETNTGLPSTPLLVGMRIGPTYGSEYSGMELFNSSFGSGYGWLINAPDRLSGNTPLVFKFRSNSGIWSDLVTFRSDSQRVGIGTNVPSSTLSVVGTVESTSGGFKFPDGSVMTSGNPVASTGDQVFHVTQTGGGAGTLTIATLPTAIRGDSSATSNYSSGVLGTSASPSGFGVVGENLASSGFAIGTFGVSTQSPTGTGVWGEAESKAAISSVGVYGKAFTPGSSGCPTSGCTSTGVFGYGAATTGDAVGVYGLSDSVAGTGVWGSASAATGATFGVYGSIASGDINAGAGVFDNTTTGNLLVGRATSTHNRVFRVDTNGTGFFSGGTQTTGADFAESVDVVGSIAEYSPGDVLIIDPKGYRRLAISSEPYSTKVAGIYSTKPGVLATPHTMDDPRLAAEVPLAIVGIVPCKVTTQNGPVEPGDLLVASPVPGYAMKGTDRNRMLGAVVGKAMQSLKQGSGLIEVLVSLH